MVLTESQRFEKFLITGIVDPASRKPFTPDRRALSSYQQVPVNYMKRHTRLMVVHGTGAGKSKTAAHIVDDYLTGNKVAIVMAPGSVLDQLRRNVLAVTGITKRVFFISYELMGRIFDPKRPEFTRLIQPWLSRMLVVCDEIHSANDKMTKKMYTPLFNIFSKAHKMVIMSATPIKNELKDLVVYMKLLGIQVPASNSNYAKAFRSKVSVYDKPPRANAYTIGRGNFPNLNLSQKNVTIALNQRNRNTILRSKVKTYGQLRTIERNVFKNRINPKFEAFYEIYRRRPMRSIVYFEEKESVKDFINFVHDTMPSVKTATITGDTTKPQKLKNMSNMNIDVYAMTSAGKVGLDFKGINNVVFMEYPWTASDYMQIVGRAVRTGSHNLSTNKTVKVYNLMYRAPHGYPAKFKNELQLNRIQQKKNIGNLVKADLLSVSIEAGSTRPNTASPARARTPNVARRVNRNTYQLSPRTMYSTAAPRSIIRAGVKYSPSNWTKLTGVAPPPPAPQTRVRPRTVRTERTVRPRTNVIRRRINATTRAVGAS